MTRREHWPVWLVAVGFFLLVFYVLPPEILKVIAAGAAGLAGVLLICMAQSALLRSGKWFRLALVILVAGLMGSALAPFVVDYEIGPWAVSRNVGLLLFVALIRWRQVNARPRESACIGKVIP